MKERGGRGERAESEEGVRFLGDGIVALRSYPMLEPNLGPLCEQYVLLKAKPSLQSCQYALSG